MLNLIIGAVLWEIYVAAWAWVQRKRTFYAYIKFSEWNLVSPGAGNAGGLIDCLFLRVSELNPSAEMLEILTASLKKNPLRVNIINNYDFLHSCKSWHEYKYLLDGRSEIPFFIVVSFGTCWEHAQSLTENSTERGYQRVHALSATVSETFSSWQSKCSSLCLHTPVCYLEILWSTMAFFVDTSLFKIKP